MNHQHAVPRLTALVFLLAVESDRRIMEFTGARVRRVSRVWATVVPLATGCDLVVTPLSAPFAQLFAGK